MARQAMGMIGLGMCWSWAVLAVDLARHWSIKLWAAHELFVGWPCSVRVLAMCWAIHGWAGHGLVWACPCLGIEYDGR